MTTAFPIRTRAILAAGVVALTTLLVAAPAARAQGEPARPAKIEAPGPTRLWLAMLVAIGVGAIAVGVAVMPSQRTHQD